MTESLSLTIATFTSNHEALRFVAYFFAVYGIWFLCAAIILGFYFFEKKAYDYMVVVAFSLALITKECIVYFFPTPRPYILYTISPLISMAPFEAYRSFPSAHAMMAFACAFVLSAYNKKFSIIVYLWALCIAISRVAVGVHFVTDIIGGAVIGSVIGFVVVWCARHYASKEISTAHL